MLHHSTVDPLHQLSLTDMAKALSSQAEQADISQFSFEGHLGLHIQKQPATLEGVVFHHLRGLDRPVFTPPMTVRWVSDHQNALIYGPLVRQPLGAKFCSCFLRGWQDMAVDGVSRRELLVTIFSFFRVDRRSPLFYDLWVYADLFYFGVPAQTGTLKHQGSGSPPARDDDLSVSGQ